MEKDFLATHMSQGLNVAGHQIIYADPMDLTKMLNINPGLLVLNGVRDTESLFYPP